jgi:hypothetical protein
MAEDLMWLEWERLNEPIEFEPEQHGPLPPWVKTITVRREGSGLALDAVGSVEHVSQIDPPEPNLREGEQLPTPPAAVGVTKYGERVVLEGVYLRGVETIGSGGRVPARVQSLAIERPGWGGVARFEWLANYSIDVCVHTRSTRRESSEKLTVKRDDFAPILIDLDKPGPGFSRSLNHFRMDLALDGVGGPILVGEGPKEAPASLRPGFIYWNPSGCPIPGDDVRDRIACALSFTLGRQLAPIGHSTFTASWMPAAAGATEGRLLQEIPQASYPPAPLYGTNDRTVVDERHFSRMVSQVASNIDRFDLDHALWLYWLGLSSPMDVQPVHFGAALEALRDAYQTAGGAALTVVADAVWEPVRDALLKELQSAWTEATIPSVPPAIGQGQSSSDQSAATALKVALGVLQYKIGKLNDQGGGKRWTDFFEAIGLPVGKVEFAAINHRHGPAHGARYPGNYRKLGIMVHALQALFNRCVLKITGGADVYRDYSTYDFPTRALNEPLGGPEGDGIPAK